MAEYHAQYGDDRDRWIGNHFTDRYNSEKVLDIIYDYMDVLDEVMGEGINTLEYVGVLAFESDDKQKEGKE